MAARHSDDVTAAPPTAPAGASDQIGFGILATGGIATSFVRDLAHVPGARAVAVGSRRQDSADSFAVAFGVDRAYGSYDGVLSDAAVDVVYVATPHALHERDVMACLEARKAVLCEKPLAVTARQAERIVADARRRGLFLAEALWMRCNPTLRRVVEAVHRGSVGDVRQVHADLGFVAARDPTSRLHDPALGASSLLDVGVYPLALVTWLLGEPVELSGAAVLDERGVDDTAGLVLSYASGAVATVSCSQQAWSWSGATVAGSGGRLEVHPRMHRPASATLYTGDSGDSGDSGDRTPLAEETIAEPVLGTGLAHEAVEVVRCLRAGETESPLLPLDDTLLVARLLDRARAACGVRLPADVED